MKIGLLLCDHVRPELRKVHQDYSDMFEQLFKIVDLNVEIVTFPVIDDIFPTNLSDFDAWLVSGSRCSVLNEHKWIEKLSRLLMTLIKQERKIIGICFGHQLIAKVLGGTVAVSDNGWGIGMSTNKVVQDKAWIQPRINTFNLVVSHKDQVIKRPESLELIAESDFCKHYMLQYKNIILTMQGHPEFSKAYIKTLMKTRQAQYPPATFLNAFQSLDVNCHDTIIAQWIMNFISME